MSKKILIKRTKPFTHESINSEAMMQQLSYTKRGLGGYFASKNSTRSGSGLTREEEVLLLPLILGIPTDDQDFWKKVDKYYTEINTNVPFGTLGLELEVGQEGEAGWINPIEIDPKSGLAKRTPEGTLVIKTVVTKTTMPLNVDDYVKYRHALKHPYCAATPQEAIGNSLVQYIIEDPSAVLASKVDQLALEDQALVDYAQVKNDPKKVKMMVTVMRNYLKARPGVPKLDPDKAGAQELLIALKELAVNKPTEFHNFATDQNISRRYFVDTLLTKGHLSRIGNTIVDTESNAPLGNNINEVILKIYDGKNTAMLNSYKAKLQDNKPILIED